MYELKSVGKRYGNATVGVHALKDVSLRVNDAQMLGIVGPSGSGKSTMLQLLGALDTPTSGSVLFDDKDLAQMGDSELTGLRRDQIGFIFQQFNLIPTLSAIDNVEVALVSRGVSSDERRSKAHAALQSVGLGERISHLPSELSGGEQQRVAIARALVGEPKVLLADEPTGNLDSATGAEVIQLLKRLNDEHGHTVILVTHDQGVAGKMSRVITLADGAIAGDSAPA